jgi:hypothetical protein
VINVLAIAPRVPNLPALATDEELATIGDTPGVRVDPITDVTRARIIDRLARGQYDVLLWIGHGQPGALLLGAHQGVDPQWLASQLSGRVGLAIIATCESGQRPESSHLVQSFVDVLPAAGIDVVTMSTEVSDRAAMAYDVALLQALASGSPLRQAHLVGVTAAAALGDGPAPQLTPRDGAAAKAQAPKEQRVDAAHDYRLNNSERMLAQMDGKMDRMGEQLNDHSTRLRLLEDQVQALRDELRRLSARLDGINTPVGYSRTVLAGGALAMTVMILLLLFLTWRLL